LERVTLQSDDTEGTTVFPDVIVHTRDSDENFLVIEMKREDAPAKSQERDQRKLDLFKSELGYTYAVFLIFSAGDAQEPSIEPTWK
jgi:hypothetical protein